MTGPATRPVVLVGCGVVGTDHAGFLRDRTDLRLATVCDPDPSARARVMKAAGAEDAVEHDSWEAALATPPAAGEVCVVATPPFLHAPVTIAALRSGRPVLCEKPMASTVEGARAMVAAADETGLLLADASSRVMGEGPITVARDLVRAGRLGRVFRATWSVRFPRLRPGIEYQPATTGFLSREVNGGGVLVDFGTYDLSVLAEVLGAPSWVTVAGALSTSIDTGWSAPEGVTSDVEWNAGATLVWEYDDGRPPVVVDWHRATAVHDGPEALARIEGVDGTAKWCAWSGFGEPDVVELVTAAADGDVASEKVPAPSLVGDRDLPLERFAADLAAGAVRAGETSSITGAEALRWMEVIFAVYRLAGMSGSERIDVRLP